MHFSSFLNTMKSRQLAGLRHRPDRPVHWRAVESLEDRRLLSGSVTLAPSDESLLVGERVTWTATATDVGVSPVYQFSAAPHGGAFHVVRDFSPANAFAWTPMQEGAYDIQVTAKDGYQGTDTASAVAVDAVASRVSGSQAVINPTPNPLVALYSVPPSSAATAFVQFSLAGDHPSWRNTDAHAVVPGKSTNFFVAGMLPNTTYQMRHVFSDGTGSAPQPFTTGTLPATLAFPAYVAQQPTGAGSDAEQDMIFHQSIKAPNNVPNPLATDLQGRVNWYYDVSSSGLIFTQAGQSLVPGGTVLLLGIDANAPSPNSRNVLREVDLAGNVVRETSLAAVNAQLTAMGHDAMHSFTHDIQRLPGGGTMVIGLTERTVTINGTPTDYIGMSVVAMDADLQLTWAWDAFDHLDVNRGPVLGEVVLPGSPEPTASVPRLPAVDWLHLNGVSLAPDGNLVMSIRHQDWVIKVDYQNGQGDGHVVWRLGEGGDFSVNSADASPWFSHQHNAHYIDDGTLVLFDNGNTRSATDPAAHSRGQVWALDEQALTATPVVNADLGAYSFALGSAQRLSNGNYFFNMGTNGTAPVRPPAHNVEVTPGGVKAYDLASNKPEYRAYRTRTLYEGTGDALAGAPQRVESIVLNDGSAQRSMVNSVTITFDGAAVLDPGSIELRRQNGTPVNFRAAISTVGGKTVAALSFTGPEFIGGSLADGTYTLTVRADHVHDRWGRELDGDGSPGGDRVYSFSRLFGDADATGDVGKADRKAFQSAFGSASLDADYRWYFDFDGDGDVDTLDKREFNVRFAGHGN